MSACVLVIGLLLAAQVGGANERYPFSGGQQAGASDSFAQGATSAGTVVQGLEPPGEGNATPDSIQPPGGTAETYGSQARQPAVGTVQSVPPGTSSSPPPAGTSPPPFGQLERQLNSSAAAAPASRTTGLKPSAMMRDILKPPRDSQLTGNSVPLIEVVAGATSRGEQAQRIEAYWDLCSSVADYYLGLREQQELQQRLPPHAQQTGDVWKQAEAELKVRIGTAHRAARASQLRLAAWLGRGTDNLPLPADTPHCGSYQARYDEIFAVRPVAEAQELAALLPLRYAELKDAATAVTRAEEWVGVVASHDKGSGDGTLRALELFALRRRAFVQLARDYNRRIARYTELAAPGEIGAERLVGMLIKSEHTATATRGSSSAPPIGRQSSNVADMPQRTFAGNEGWEPAGSRADTSRRDDAIQPASGASQPRRERSLLVAPR